MDDGKFYLTLMGPILDPQTAQLIQILDQTIRETPITHLYLAINTPGGSVNAGIMLYHYLRSLSITVTTHNVGQVDSIGNVIFLGGTERYASPATSFMLHGVSVQIQGQMLKSQLDEVRSQIEQDEQRISTITTDRTTLTKAKLTTFFRTGRSLSPTEAKSYGIVTDIREFEIPNGAKSGVVNTFPPLNQGNVANALNLF